MLVFVVQMCDLFKIEDRTHGPHPVQKNTHHLGSAAVPAHFLHHYVARYRGGERDDANTEDDTERVRLWTAACLACHISYGTVAEGGAEGVLRLARSDRLPLADWIRIEQAREQWCLFSGAAPGGGEILLLAWRGTVLHRLEDLVADLHCRQARNPTAFKLRAAPATRLRTATSDPLA